jgi:enoyl-CoA hydratase/carnithine racemase
VPYTYDYVRTLIVNVAPGSLRETKRQIYPDLHRDVRSTVAGAAALLERMATRLDFEGMSAFLQQRPPRRTKKK